MLYVAPPPTPEQIANAAGRWDSNDLLGISRWWALSARHRLVAAAVIHDELYLYAMTREERAVVDANFVRDCLILARAERSLSLTLQAYVFKGIILTAKPFIDTSTERNTDVTRAQGIERMLGAKRHINAAARQIGVDPPYLGIEL